MEYTLKRSSRKTLALVVKGSTLFVHAPMRVPKFKIDEFVANNLEWINKKLENSKINSLPDSIVNFEQVLVLGNLISTKVHDKRGVSLVDGTLYLNAKADRKTQLLKWYKEQAHVWLQQQIDAVANSLNLSYTKFDLTSARTKWGSCDNNCKILLNFRLIMLPKELIYYVITHELCHTVHHNHSAEFWQMVLQFCPMYKKYRKELKQWAQLNKIY